MKTKQQVFYTSQQMISILMLTKSTLSIKNDVK